MRRPRWPRSSATDRSDRAIAELQKENATESVDSVSELEAQLKSAQRQTTITPTATGMTPQQCTAIAIRSRTGRALVNELVAARADESTHAKVLVRGRVQSTFDESV